MKMIGWKDQYGNKMDENWLDNPGQALKAGLGFFAMIALIFLAWWFR